MLRHKLLHVLGPVLLIKKIRINPRSVKFYDNDPELMDGTFYYTRQTSMGWYQRGAELNKTEPQPYVLNKSNPTPNPEQNNLIPMS